MALKEVNYDNKIFNISYEIINQNSEKTIVLLHGWGSNKDIMKQAFSKYLQNFRHIYIDMPGFGKSDNEYILTTLDYSNIVKTFLNSLSIKLNDNVSMLGHSFGGKVATLLSSKNLILISSAGIVEEKSFDVKIKIFINKLFKKIGLRWFDKIFRSKDVHLMSQNMYETFKNVLNEDFTTHFQNYNGNCMIFWGEKDSATSLKSGKKIHSLIKNSTFKTYNSDHFVFLKFAEDISKEVAKKI